jgi:hypothetical protein
MNALDRALHGDLSVDQSELERWWAHQQREARLAEAEGWVRGVPHEVLRPAGSPQEPDQDLPEVDR